MNRITVGVGDKTMNSGNDGASAGDGIPTGGIVGQVDGLEARTAQLGEAHEALRLACNENVRRITAHTEILTGKINTLAEGLLNHKQAIQTTRADVWCGVILGLGAIAGLVILAREIRTLRRRIAAVGAHVEAIADVGGTA